MAATNSPSGAGATDVRSPHRRGDRVGRYVLTRPIGTGATGEIWVAQDTLLAMSVALKVLQPSGVGWFGESRLLHEGRSAAELEHPAIVRVLDFGTSADGEPYLALELLTGQTLTSFAEAGPVSPELAVRLMLPVLDALALAHEHGIVHRDIKPDNLFVARNERGRLQPKLLDFGVAKSCSPLAARLTQPGRTVGSPAYMAPEQARGEEDIDGRADLWSVAVTLYELVSGRLPFEGATIPHLLTAIVVADPPPLSFVHGVDDELSAILACAMAKSRDARFPDARAMGEALARWLVARGVHEDVSGASLRLRWLPSTPSDAAVTVWRASGQERSAPRDSRPTLRASGSALSTIVPPRLAAPARRHAWLAAVAACAAISVGLVAARPLPASSAPELYADGAAWLLRAAIDDAAREAAPPTEAAPPAEHAAPAASPSSSATRRPGSRRR